MHWKKLPYWLKGGIISLGFLIILWLINWIIGEYCVGIGDPCYNKVNPILNPLINFLVFFDFLSIPFCGGICKDWTGLIHIFTIWPSYAILGIGVGYIFGKLKSK